MCKTFFFTHPTWNRIIKEEPGFAREIIEKSNSVWTIGGVRRYMDNNLAQQIIKRWPELKVSFDYENKHKV